MENHNQRNLILAVVLTALILFGWDAALRYMYPNADKAQPVAEASAGAAPADAAKPTREGGLTNAADIAAEARDLKTALNPAARVAIAAPGLTGSINLAGGVLDDLTTNRHTAALDPRTAAFVLELTVRIVAEHKLTTMMVTHSMRQALDVGERTVMLHQGRVVLDVSGPEREGLDVHHLLEMFEKVRGEEIDDDKLLLS